MAHNELAGVFAAAITPINSAGHLEVGALPEYLAFLEKSGCHGALLAGTTGEGPSLSARERLMLFEAATGVWRQVPEMKLLAGTGTPSLSETVELTRAAFELGFNGVLVLPPFYYRKASVSGIFDWYAQVIEDAVPPAGACLGYHIPQVSGVPLPAELLGKLADAYPARFAGLKDSSGSAEFGQEIAERFGRRLSIFTGHDRLLSLALSRGGAGAITALANILAPLHRAVWEENLHGNPNPGVQELLDSARKISDRYAPAPGLLKAILHRKFGFPEWLPRLPLEPQPEAAVEQAIQDLEQAGVLDASARALTPDRS